jgi:hypothetical protein
MATTSGLKTIKRMMNKKKMARESMRKKKTADANASCCFSMSLK